MSVPSSAVGLRVAVIGVGARAEIGRHVAEASPGSTVVAAVDPSPAGRERARALFGGIPVFADLPGLVAAGGVDAAVVAAPDDAHAELAIALLRAGIAVYLEKPLATRLEDADRVLATAAATGTALYVGHNFRHAAVVRLMKAIIDEGRIGRVRAVWVRHFVGNGGDYYFRDWHADRRRTNGLLLQKASHDLDVIHHLAGGVTRRVSAMGDLLVYGATADRREPAEGATMPDWFSLDHWPPHAVTGLHPVIDVEDVSMVHLALDNGVLASYEQCHFTPDYWRNYTVIGDEGRLENVGDTAGGVVKVWTSRREGFAAPDLEYPIEGVALGHEDADLATMREFLRHVADGAPTLVSPLAARAAVAAGDLATRSLRMGSRPLDVPPLPPEVVAHFS